LIEIAINDWLDQMLDWSLTLPTYRLKIFLTCFLAFLVLSLSACQVSLLSDLVVSPGTLLFRDDFSNNSAGWPQISGPEGSMGVMDGSYRFQIQASNFKMLAASGHTFRDAQVEADLTSLTGSEQDVAGLVCRLNGSQDFYFFVISSDGFYALGKNLAGNTTIFGQDMMVRSPEIKPGQVGYTLNLTCTGSTLSGYVDGKLIDTATDAELRFGDVGFLVGSTDFPGVDVSFDNLLVSKP
jgi:hypothetical protein